MIKFYTKRALQFSEALKEVAYAHQPFFKGYDIKTSFNTSGEAIRVYAYIHFHIKHFKVAQASNFRNVEYDLQDFRLEWKADSYDCKNDCTVYKADVTSLFLSERDRSASL